MSFASLNATPVATRRRRLPSIGLLGALLLGVASALLTGLVVGAPGARAAAIGCGTPSGLGTGATGFGLQAAWNVGGVSGSAALGLDLDITHFPTFLDLSHTDGLDLNAD